MKETSPDLVRQTELSMLDAAEVPLSILEQQVAEKLNSIFISELSLSGPNVKESNSQPTQKRNRAKSTLSDLKFTEPPATKR